MALIWLVVIIFAAWYALACLWLKVASRRGLQVTPAMKRSMRIGGLALLLLLLAAVVTTIW